MAFLLKFLVVLTRMATVFLNFVYWIIHRRDEKKCVPPCKDDLLLISATKLSDLIRKKKVSSEDVVRAYINRIKEVNPLINAVVEDRFEDALKEAKNVSDYLRTTSLTMDELQKFKPLLGVPITIKESCMLAGMSLAVGVVSRKGIKAESDGDAVARIKMTGAIPLLVSNTPELCLGFYCNNNITGRTNNPYDLSRNSGGSSGGEAALLGSAASLVGIGSDIAGSVRFPAFCCGVFGHKPSPRAVPIKGHFPQTLDKKASDYLSIGPLTRYAEDLKLLMIVMSGKQSNDLRLSEKVDLSKLRVHYMKEAPSCIMSPRVKEEIKDSILESAKFLEKTSGSKVIHECNLKDDFRRLFEVSSALLTNLDMDGFPNPLKGPSNYYFLEVLKSLVGRSEVSAGCTNFRLQFLMKNYLSSEEYNELNNEIRRKIALELGEDGVLLYPTFHTPAPRHETVALETIANVYMMPFNTLGLPATNVPCGITAEGIPLGLHYIMDRNLIVVAFNYRINVAGFLSTGDSELYGNNGFKDQVLALKWIQKNIKAFGGNPNSVTITGNSAGAVSTNYHYISPLSKGLFHKGWSSSYTVLGSLALTLIPDQKCKLLASLVGCPTDTSKNMVACLTKQPIEKLVNQRFIWYKPAVEKGNPNAFVPDNAYTLLKEGKVHNLPWVASNVKDEALFALESVYKNRSEVFAIYDNFIEWGKRWLDLDEYVDEDKMEYVINELKKYYLDRNGKLTEENGLERLNRLLSDRHFLVAGDLTIRTQSAAVKTPVYYYLFEFVPDDNIQFYPPPAASHAVDSRLIFKFNTNPDRLHPQDERMMRILTQFVEEYARTGVPKIGNVTWIPLAPNEQKLNVLSIKSPDKIEMIKLDELAPRKLWDRLPIKENKYLYHGNN